MLFALLTAAVAVAAPADFHVVMEKEDCTFYMGAREADGVTPVQVECRWSDVEKESLDALLRRVDTYHDIVWAIEDSRVVRVEGERSLVWQRHHVPGTAAREAMVWMAVQPTAAGGTRYAWTTADEAFTSGRGTIQAPRNDGFWEVTPTADGVEVILQGSYDPGGWVPDWLVRWCQTVGAERVMNDLHERAAGTVVAMGGGA